MDLQIAGRVALVCGSSRGLGYAIARRLAEAGCRVALNGRERGRLDEGAARLREATGAEVAAFPGDVADPDAVGAIVTQVQARLGDPDIVVCNAGGPAATTFADAEDGAWRAALDLNLLSTIHLCRRTVPAMRAAGWGRVICLTSVAAREPMAGLILSTTARAGVLGFAKSLADEVAPDGVTVNCVCPGYIRTDRVRSLVAGRAEREARGEDAVVADLVARIPAGRMGEPDELGAAVAFLASEPARYITGTALAVDGGYVRSIT